MLNLTPPLITLITSIHGGVLRYEFDDPEGPSEIDMVMDPLLKFLRENFDDLDDFEEILARFGVRPEEDPDQLALPGL